MFIVAYFLLKLSRTGHLRDFMKFQLQYEINFRGRLPLILYRPFYTNVKNLVKIHNLIA